VGDAQEVSGIKIKLLPTSGAAFAAALIDLKTQNPLNQLFYRYIWIDTADQETAQTVSFALNTISRGDQIYRPVPIAAGPVMLLRFDIRWYAPLINDQAEWIEFWEDLGFDPALNILITKGALDTAIRLLPDWRGSAFVKRQVLVPSPPWVQNGVEHRQKWAWRFKREQVTLADVKREEFNVIRIPDPQIDQEVFGELATLTGSFAPVVSQAYFRYRVLAAIQDKGLYADVYGGRYYEFADIRVGAKKGTDEDVLFEQLGVGNVKAGITAKKLYEKLASDRRSAQIRSDVTGFPRQIEFLPQLATTVDTSVRIISVTHDLKEDDIDVDVHPLANLLDFKDFAREVIWDRANGHHGYTAINGDGAIQREVPFNVTLDHTISHNRPKRLQPAISCIACHEAEGSDGWRPFRNDVKDLLEAKAKGKELPDIFGDLGQNRFLFDEGTNRRLSSLYRGDPEAALVQGRNSYARAVLKATGPFKAAEPKNQADIIRYVATKTVDLWRGYMYDLVTPERALRELGVSADPKDATKVLTAILEPDPKAAGVGPDGQPVIFEDFRIAFMRAGKSISRTDFDFSRGFAAQRVAANLAKLLKEKQK